MTAAVLVALAEALQRQGQVQRAARLLGAASSEEHTGVWQLNTRAEYTQSVAATKAALGEAAFAAAWAEGQAMTLEQAVACALEESH